MNELEPIDDRREWLRVFAWAFVLFAACLFVYTRHNQFPYFYHPDEPGKVEQVLTGEWNFHHPMLLLTATRAAVKIAGVPGVEQPVVEVGRWVSAGFAAVAAVALALLAFAWRGWVASFATGFALLCHHQFYELAHYMKEDTALVAGLSLTFLMLLACWWRASLGRAALLGIACGLAVSGKYLGVIAIGFAVPVLWRIPERRGARLGVFAGALVLTFCALNLPLLLHLATFRQSFGREMDFVINGQRGMTRSVPHTQYWNAFRDNSTPAFWVLLIIFLHARWHERRRLSLPEWIIVAFPYAYALALSFSPKSNDRYFLPATAIFTLQAALGTKDLAHAFAWRRTRRRWLAAAVAAFLACQLVSLPRPLAWHTLAEYSRAVQVDDNAALLRWVRAELPATAVIARDSRIMLPDPARKRDVRRLGAVPQQILSARFAADLGTVAELREKGVTHVAISESDYGRFFLDGLRPQASERTDFERRKTFYEDLLRDGELVFERDRGTVIYLHPGIRVYRLSSWVGGEL